MRDGAGDGALGRREYDSAPSNRRVITAYSPYGFRRHQARRATFSFVGETLKTQDVLRHRTISPLNIDYDTQP